MHILPNISRSTDNQTMKTGQLTEYNMRNICFEESYKKYGNKASLKPFNKKLKLSYHCINSLQYYKVCFYFVSKLISTKIY